MEIEEIRNKVASVFREVFSDDIVLEDDTSSRDIRSWDSLKHVVLINAVEQAFNISFDIDEMLDMQSFGSIYNAVESKVNS